MDDSQQFETFEPFPHGLSGETPQSVGLASHDSGAHDSDSHVQRLYTPAMLADLLGVDVGKVRRWVRRGLLAPTKVVKRLIYFDFEKLAQARRLAELLAAGFSADALRNKLDALRRFLPSVEQPLAELVVEGRDLLLRQETGLIDQAGQKRFDFDATDDNDLDESRIVLTPGLAPPSIVQMAAELEEMGELKQAAEMYRAAMAAAGPRPEWSFQLAEVLYRLGDLPAARERYYLAIELDEDFVEARSNLGCLLAEQGDSELAVAAFEGAIAHHPQYPDAHFHLARTLDEMHREPDALAHWQTFLELAPEGPWAEMAAARVAVGE